jgi:hypothetical protein
VVGILKGEKAAELPVRQTRSAASSPHKQVGHLTAPKFVNELRYGALLKREYLPFNVRYWLEADMPKNAIDVDIGGKADMTFCSANVCF